MWQAVLASEGFLTTGQIDGQFGPITAAATRSWQDEYEVGIDGEVGNETWSRADDFLTWESASSLIYVGVGGGKVTFYRGSESKSRDSGAYELLHVRTPTGVVRNFGGTRIQFYSKTVI